MLRNTQFKKSDNQTCGIYHTNADSVNKWVRLDAALSISRLLFPRMTYITVDTNSQQEKLSNGYLNMTRCYMSGEEALDVVISYYLKITSLR